MKKVLWLSRHDMSAKQQRELEDALGSIKIIQHKDEVKDAKEILEIGWNCDIYAVILPLNILQDLANRTNVPIIRPVMNKEYISTANGKSSTTLTHDHWEKVIEINIVTEKLSKEAE